MIKEFAIADAYAQAFEFIKEPEEHGLSNKLVKGCLNFQQNPKYVDLKLGDFTDDTIRTLASSSCLNVDDIEDKSQLFHFYSIVEYFWKLHRKGWSGRFQNFIEDNKDALPKEFIYKVVKKPTNGAIMGVLPFGYLDTIYKVKTVAAAHAFSTHSASTIPYAQATALCVYYLRNNRKKDAIVGLRNFLLDNVEELSIFKGNPSSMKASETFNVVLDQIEKADKQQSTMTRLVLDCVKLGGDTDTIAALSAGIYSHSWHYVNNADYFVEKNFSNIEKDKPENRKLLEEIDGSLEKDYGEKRNF